MKIAMKAEMMVLAKCDPTKSRDGQNTYYKLTVMQGQEAGQISCPEDVYMSIETGMKAVLNVEYNSEYKSLRIMGIASETLKHPEPSKQSGQTRQQ